MNIQSLDLENFMIFKKLHMDLSPNINLICGENSTGKTIILKALYSAVKAYEESLLEKNGFSAEGFEKALSDKYIGVFRPDKDRLIRLLRDRDKEAFIGFSNDTDEYLRFHFNTGESNLAHLSENTLSRDLKMEALYIPTMEIISFADSFSSLYKEGFLNMEETYYDLARKLKRPIKDIDPKMKKKLIDKIKRVLGGSVVKKDKRFYILCDDGREIEMSLISEGYRKIACIYYLVMTGSLNEESVLFWDEPEANMNPKMISVLADILVELADLGIQIFVSTHDYFVQQSFGFNEKYDKRNIKYSFISLYNDDGEIKCEYADKLMELKHNAIMEEFDLMYEREIRAIEDN